MTCASKRVFTVVIAAAWVVSCGSGGKKDDTGCKSDLECAPCERCGADGVCDPRVCDDDNACTLDSCDPASGCLFEDDSSSCDDGNPCTDDGCDPSSGCTLEANADPCDDGLHCTGSDVCSVGVCTHSGNDCTGREFCDEETDSCVPLDWYGLGGSDFGPWNEYLSWGSAAGGGVNDDGWSSEGPVVAVDADGDILMGWLSWSTGQMFMKRFDVAAGAWVEVGAGSASDRGVTATTGLAQGYSLAMDPDGNLFVAWLDDSSGSFRIYVKRFDPVSGTWVEVGTGSASGGGISGTTASAVAQPSLAIDPLGEPVVAWPMGTLDAADVYVKRFDPVLGTWVEVGTGSASGGGISGTASVMSVGRSLGMDADGNITVTWSDSSAGQAEIYVKRFNATLGTWSEVGAGSASGGGVSNSAGDSWLPRLALDAAGDPVVAWSDYTVGVERVYVRRYDASTDAWVELGTGSATGSGVDAAAEVVGYPALVADLDGNPILSWYEGQGDHSNILLRRYVIDTGAWEDVGVGSGSGEGVSHSPLYAISPEMALDDNGNPVVAWTTVSALGQNVNLSRMDPATGQWEGAGGNASGGGVSDTLGVSTLPSVVLDAGDAPMVAWQDDTSGAFQIYVRRYDATGDAWVEVGEGAASGGGVTESASGAYEPFLALDATGVPVLAWVELPPAGTDYKIHVKRFEAGAWVQMGPGSATGDGVSDAPGAALRPCFVNLESGDLLLAWHNKIDEENFEIYAKRFDATLDAWVEMGTGSASGGGVSGTAGLSFEPALALDGSKAPVLAWQEGPGGEEEIYVRRYDETTEQWLELGTGSASGGGVSGTDGYSALPSLVLTASGDLVVSWEDASSGVQRIYVKRFDVTLDAWAELGTGSATGDGVGGLVCPSRTSLALGESGEPVLVWQEMDWPSFQILATRFDAESGEWVERGAGSRGEYGISNSSMTSEWPALASGSGGRICVAWKDTGAWSEQVVLRCSGP